MIFIKQGVVLANLQDDWLLEPACVLDEILHEKNLGHAWITSGIEGNHNTNSYHYAAGQVRGQAIDLRLPGNAKQNEEILLEMKRRLPKWRTILEGDHYHVQRFKTGTNF